MNWGGSTCFRVWIRPLGDIRHFITIRLGNAPLSAGIAMIMKMNYRRRDRNYFFRRYPYQSLNGDTWHPGCKAVSSYWLNRVTWCTKYGEVLKIGISTYLGINFTFAFCLLKIFGIWLSVFFGLHWNIPKRTNKHRETVFGNKHPASILAFWILLTPTNSAASIALNMFWGSKRDFTAPNKSKFSEFFKRCTNATACSHLNTRTVTLAAYI